MKKTGESVDERKMADRCACTGNGGSDAGGMRGKRCDKRKSGAGDIK